jgi:hypothetical protein
MRKQTLHFAFISAPDRFYLLSFSARSRFLVTAFNRFFGRRRGKQELTPTFSLLLYFAGGEQTQSGKGHDEKKGFDLDSNYRLHDSCHVGRRGLRRVQEGG